MQNNIYKRRKKILFFILNGMCQRNGRECDFFLFIFFEDGEQILADHAFRSGVGEKSIHANTPTNCVLANYWASGSTGLTVNAQPSTDDTFNYNNLMWSNCPCSQTVQIIPLHWLDRMTDVL